MPMLLGKGSPSSWTTEYIYTQTPNPENLGSDKIHVGGRYARLDLQYKLRFG